MAFIEDRGERPGLRWRVRYRDPEGRERSKSFARKTDAHRFKAEQEAKLHKGEWLDPDAGRITFGEWAARWLAGLHSIKPKTLAGYESLLRVRVLPTFAGVELRRITPALVREWQTELLGEVSPARVRQARQVLSAALEVASGDGLIPRNPCDRVKPPAVRERRQLFLTAAEVRTLAAACEARQAGSGALVTFLAYSGLRWGEAVALRWGAVGGRRVRVRESATEVRGSLEWGTPKTHEARTVILPGFVAEVLGEPGGSEALIFTAPRGGPLRNSNFRNQVWRPALAAAGAPEGLHIHDLRHTAASLAISAGASIKAVQRMLGHASAAMTLDRYGHLYEEDLETLAERMDTAYRDAAGNVTALRAT
jgi:integrase